MSLDLRGCTQTLVGLAVRLQISSTLYGDLPYLHTDSYRNSNAVIFVTRVLMFDHQWRATLRQPRCVSLLQL